MSNFLSDQFNNDPVSTTVRTTSYTIPTGGYARVRPVEFEDDFQIDSTVVIDARKYSGSAGASTAGTKFSNSSNYTLVGRMNFSADAASRTAVVRSSGSGGSTNNFYSNDDQTLSTTNGGKGIVLAPGDSIVVTVSGPGTFYWSLTAIDPIYPLEFWVPEDTLIEGTKFIVELYNKQGA